MNTFRKYEKTYRIVVEGIPIAGKFSLDNSETKRLIGGRVVVTEKMDGANVGIYKNKGKLYLQKRGSNIDHSHYQYTFFEQWAYENMETLKQLPDETVTYGELMRCVHSVYYDKLPDWFLVFDIYDLKEERYLSWDEIIKITGKVGLHTVPFIYEGKTNMGHIKSIVPKESAYGDFAEGIVIKNYRQQIRGKIVKPEFIKVLDESDNHWMNKEIKLNKVI